MIRLRSCLAIAALLAARAAHAHPDEALDAVRLLVHRFALGLINDDVATVSATLAGDGRFLGLSREEFIAGFAQQSELDSVSLAAATFEPIPEGMRIEPIVGSANGGTFQVVWSASVATRDGELKLVALESRPEVPAAFVPRNLTEQQPATTPVTFSLVDARTRQPVPARVHLADAGGGYWPPRGHQKNIRTGWRQDVGGDVRIADATWAYVPGEFTADLPRGHIHVEVEKGMEHAPARWELD